jgi:hypothetical protein
MMEGEQRLIPVQTARHVAYPYDRPRALHRIPSKLKAYAEASSRSRHLRLIVADQVLKT